MSIKTLLAAVVLAGLPVMALAEGCGRGHSESANSCAFGEVWDTGSQSCVRLSSS